MILYPFQREGVEFIKSNGRVLLADEPGLGKTIQAIVAIDEAAYYPCLIVCPTSMKATWAREFKTWTDIDVTPDVVGDITITNYERINRLLPDIKNIRYSSLVCDESHYLKNPKAKRTKQVKAIASTIPHKILMTGTPVLNRPVELISQLDILGRLKDFGSSWKFIQRYCNPIRTQWGWDLTGSYNLKELNQKLNGIFLRRTKESVAIDLPQKTYSLVPISITNAKKYKTEEKKVISNPGDQLARIEKLRTLAYKGKEKVCLEWIENFIASGEKLVVFMHHRELQQAMLDRFPDACTIYGDQSMKSRESNMFRFQYGDGNLMLCSLQAAGVGITLTSASNIVFLEYPWTPGLLNQAIDRVHRITQTKPVTVWYLYAKDTIEEDILCLLENKEVVTSIIHDGRVITKGIIKKLLGGS